MTDVHMPLQGRNVALCVTGSIAAYKAVELARLLVAAGARVTPVMTAAAARFVGPLTLSGVTRESVAIDMWDPTYPGEMHVRIAQSADLIVVAPATADILSRFAHGRADDLVTAIVLCAHGPVLAAPAMHPRMWEHPATQRNVTDLAVQGRITLVGPVVGEVASGDLGIGRMSEPSAIFGAIEAALAPKDLLGVRVVVTAGPTLEDIDPVRFLGNRSSGKMGFAIARQAALRGADVMLVAGPVSLPTPAGVRRIDVRDARAMCSAVQEAMGGDLEKADVLVMAAAVADHRPAEASPTKIKKGDERTALELLKNPDILAQIGALRSKTMPILVGFAVETAGGEDLVAYARRKCQEKRVDLVVANEAGDAFGRDDNRAIFVSRLEAESLPAMSKARLASVLLDRVRDLAKDRGRLVR